MHRIFGVCLSSELCVEIANHNAHSKSESEMIARLLVSFTDCLVNHSR